MPLIPRIKSPTRPVTVKGAAGKAASSNKVVPLNQKKYTLAPISAQSKTPNSGES